MNNSNQVYTRKKSSGFLQKLSKGLMLPIAILPLAGLMLGLGAGIANIMLQAGVSPDSGWFIITTLMNKTGDMIFGNLPILFAVAIAIAYSNDAGTAALAAVVGWVTFNATQSVFISDAYTLADGQSAYNILFYLAVPSSVVGLNIGITSMQTSVFGGMVIGGVAAYSYNRFHQTKLPTALGFFQGTRMVPLVAMMLSIIAGMGFVVVWPIAGKLLDSLGRELSTMPTGVDSFIYGTFSRILGAFGLHHAFYTPLWFTSVGGQFLQDGVVVAEGNNYIWQYINGQYGLDPMLTFKAITAAPVVNGYHTLTTAEHTYQLTEGVSPSSYMQGGYPIMMFGLPAAGLAIVMAAKKDNRSAALSVIAAAALTSFLTGITEPLEYTFLFLSPMLYAIHAVYEGISYALMDILGCHIGVSFSRGIIDLIIFGAIPSFTGNATGWLWVLPLGLVYAPIYYFTFYFWIVKFDLATPGRDNDDVSLMSKSDYKNRKGKEEDREERLNELLDNLGGIDNLTSIDACITRLRLSVVDREKVIDKNLKAMGAAGIVGNGNAIQIIFGGEADIFKSELIKLKK